METPTSEIVTVGYGVNVISADGKTALATVENEVNTTYYKSSYSNRIYTITFKIAGTYRIIGVFYGSGVKSELKTFAANATMQIKFIDSPTSSMYVNVIIYKV